MLLPLLTLILIECHNECFHIYLVRLIEYFEILRNIDLILKKAEATYFSAIAIFPL